MKNARNFSQYKIGGSLGVDGLFHDGKAYCKTKESDL